MEEIDKEMKDIPLLSISIPTWNRAKFLAISLESFLNQMKGINPEDVELFVSDNCSDDSTAEVVKGYIDKGLPINYSKNEENIGASRNFLRCMQRASGKYILLLGDDDVLNLGTDSIPQVCFFYEKETGKMTSAPLEKIATFMSDELQAECVFNNE